MRGDVEAIAELLLGTDREQNLRRESRLRQNGSSSLRKTRTLLAVTDH
jgi:hypothetical protein